MLDYSVFVYILCIQYNSSDIYLKKTGTYTGNGPLQDNTIFTLHIRCIIKISTYTCMVCIYVTSIYWQFSFKFISPLINWNMTIQICPISNSGMNTHQKEKRNKETIFPVYRNFTIFKFLFHKITLCSCFKSK